MSKRVLTGVGCLFFLSGFAALVYQVAWQRLLALHSGVGAYSVAVIVAAFMAGLGFGSHLGGRLCQRLSPARALTGFAVLELSIGAFGLASVFFYYDLLYVHVPFAYHHLATAAVAHLLALVVPTSLMGMSLPFLTRAFVVDTENAPRTIGYLYAVNALGAACGALLTPWVLMRYAGVSGAIHVAAIANCVVGVGTLAFRRSAELAARDAAPAPVTGAASIEPPGSRSFSLWLALYALSGFCALALEIYWFRIVDVAVKSSAFTFGTVLAVYLCGLAAGSFVGTARAARVIRPLRVFLACQCGIGIYAASSVALTAYLPRWASHSWFPQYWMSTDGYDLGFGWEVKPLLALYVVLPSALYLIPTFLMGLSFPILQRAVQDDPATAGKRVGFLQASNIAGCVMGSLVVGLGIFNAGGSPAALRIVLVGSLLFAAVGIVAYGWRGRFAVLAASIVLLMLAIPDVTTFWGPMHGAFGEALIEEDASSVVGIVPHPASPGRWRVMVNGLGHSVLPFGGIHSLLGALPVVVHADPREIAIIGLGSGDTARSAACRRETESVRVFEIAGRQEFLLRRFAVSLGDARLRGFLDDPRVSIVVEDGRHALHRDNTLYDVIEMDPLNPRWAYSGHLYSVEFFQLCLSRLKPGGIVCIWAPTPRVRRSFAAAFPHCVEFQHGTVMVGSGQPMPLTVRTWAKRLKSPAVSAYLGEGTTGLVLDALWSAQAHEAVPGDSNLNWDLFPRDEFSSPEN